MGPGRHQQTNLHKLNPYRGTTHRGHLGQKAPELQSAKDLGEASPGFCLVPVLAHSLLVPATGGTRLNVSLSPFSYSYSIPFFKKQKSNSNISNISYICAPIFIHKSKFSERATQICLTSPHCIKSHWPLLKAVIELVQFSFLNYLWTFLYLLACNESRARKGQTFSLYGQLPPTAEQGAAFSPSGVPRVPSQPNPFTAGRSPGFSRLPQTPSLAQQSPRATHDPTPDRQTCAGNVEQTAQTHSSEALFQPF